MTKRASVSFSLNNNEGKVEAVVAESHSCSLCKIFVGNEANTYFGVNSVNHRSSDSFSEFKGIVQPL